MKPKWNLEKLGKINKSYLLAAALLGILLLVIAIPTEDRNKQEQSQTTTSREREPVQTSSDQTYRKSLERQLEQMLSAMEGVGKAEVMITLKDSGEAVVEKDFVRTEEHASESQEGAAQRENSTVSVQQSSLYTKNGSQGEVPFISKERNPQIEGVLVVAEGGENSVTVKNISEAILALFPIEAHKIKVVKMN